MYLNSPKYIIAVAALLVAFAGSVSAQNQRRGRGDRPVFGNVAERTLPAPPDSLELIRLDSIRVADSLFRADSAEMMRYSSLDRPAFSNAKDSIVEKFIDGSKMIYYYGDVSVEYDDMTLTSAYMEYDMNSGEVFARGILDTLTGEWTGKPVMKQGGKEYNMDEVRYNFNSRKARISNMTTTDDQGIIHGKNIKMMPDNSINITKGQYTVCDAEEPHYYLKLSSAKVSQKPNKKTVFGPAHLVVEGVDLPLFIPFGFIPERPQRATGFLMPTFGEETARGFYIRDAGMYFVFGDHFDLSATGSYFTLGSWSVDINSRYKVNYKFTGGFGLTYSVDKTGEKGSQDYFESTNFSVKWSHSQDSKAHPGSTFSASVNFSSPSNSRYNSRSVTEALQNQASSSISYSRNWNGKFNLSINALHSQNSRDSSYAFTLPNVTFSMSTIYPFKQKNRIGKEKFYEKISFGYSTTLQNKINFKASEFGQIDMLDRLQNGMTHNFNIGLPSFLIMKYINVSPSVSYGMNWFFRKTEYEYNPEEDKVEAVQGHQFSHFGITQTYSGAISMSTRIYGTFNFGKRGKLQALRHVISPSLSLSYSPEKGTFANGYRTLYYTDASGNDKEYQYNIYSGQLYSAPGKGQSASASFSIGNNLEAKVRDYADTTGKGTKKVKLIDQLNINGGYNFLADSMRLSNISMSMSTNLFEKVNISMSANFDPYAVNDKGQRYSHFAITEGQGLARLTNASASASYSISGKGTIKGNDGSGTPGNVASYYQRIYTHPVTGEYIPGGWLYYTNPNVPWSVNFNYSISYSRAYANEEDRLVTKHNITQTLGFSGNIKLTPRLSLNATSGFDFQALKLSTTQISASYDLHCFEVSVSWVPTGKWQSYSFLIRAKAAALADLLRFKKSSSYWDN